MLQQSQLPASRDGGDGGPPAGWRVWCAAGLIVVVGAVVYANSFSGAFVLDDEWAIQRNRLLRPQTPLWELFKRTRPVLKLSLALNYRLDYASARSLKRSKPRPGEDVWGYHLVNVTVHILAALALFAVLRRTLFSDRLRERFGRAALPLALASALIWMVHPLQTNAVTYVIQRAEAMMGMFFLLTMYCAVRAFQARRGRWAWYAGATLACLLGAGCKEVMIVAPIVVVVYALIFAGRSPGQVLRRHVWFFVLLGVVAVLLAAHSLAVAGASKSAGWGNVPGVSWYGYAATQFGVILRYLRLSFWPTGLCLDYGWPMAKTFTQIVPPALVVVALLVATGVGLWRRPELGFLGVWFFLILAPTSSIMPIKDLIFEHRMYLSLAAVVVAVVCGVYRLGGLVGRRLGLPGRALAAAGALAAIAAVAGLGVLTVRRNAVFQAESSVWRDVIAKRPDNARAHSNLGKALFFEGKIGQAIPEYRRAIELDDKYADPWYNLGVSYSRLGNPQAAIDCYKRAIKLNPKFVPAYNNLGTVLAKLGKNAEAVRYYAKALKIEPRYAMAHSNMGVALAKLNRLDEAAKSFRKAVEAEPEYAEAYHHLGVVLGRLGKVDEAIEAYRKALRRDEGLLRAHFNLAGLLAARGKVSEALEHYQRVVELRPQYVPGRFKLAELLAAVGDVGEALRHYREVIRLKPNHVAARFQLGRLLAAVGDVQGALEQLSQVVRLDPKHARAYNELGKLLGRMGNLKGAAEYYTQAIAIDANFAEAHNNLGVVRAQQGRGRLAAAHYYTAMRLQPNNVVAMNNLARLRATHPNEQVRNAEEAIKLAQEACRLTGNKRPMFLATLAAAYAEAARFEEAIRTVRKAIELAGQAGRGRLVKQFQAELKLYQAKRPLRSRPVG